MTVRKSKYLNSGVMKKAFRKHYDFAPNNPERYLIFLKEHFTRIEPNFYSVIHRTKINTVDGIMFALELAEDIENPDRDVVAECIINGESIYLWRDHCWGIAVDKNGREIRSSKKSGSGFTFAKLISNKSKVCLRGVSGQKAILLFKIGIDPVE